MMTNEINFIIKYGKNIDILQVTNTISCRAFIKKGPWEEGLKSSKSPFPQKWRQEMISMAILPLDGCRTILKYSVFWLISNLLCYKLSQFQTVERRGAAGSVLEIVTVISMTEYKAVQPTAWREELSFKESTY